MSWHSRYWAPYVPVAVRRARAMGKLKALEKKGLVVSPVEADGRELTRTFWGQAWCRNLESYSDYENRLPRGRTYLRNGSVMHLEVASGRVTGLVCGSELYDVEVSIAPVAARTWSAIRRECTGKIASLVSLLRGELPGPVMNVVTRHGAGLFPAPAEIRMKCSCPDDARLCKHLAAVLYGVGVRLDEKPDLLFLLRGVDHAELVTEAAGASLVAGAPEGGKTLGLDAGGLSALFGIEVEAEAEAPAAASRHRPRSQTRKRPARAAKKTAPARARKDAGATRPRGRGFPALRPGTTVTAKELEAIGISAAARRGWLMEEVLERTPHRGVYLATARTSKRVAVYLERKRTSRVPG